MFLTFSSHFTVQNAAEQKISPTEILRMLDCWSETAARGGTTKLYFISWHQRCFTQNPAEKYLSGSEAHSSFLQQSPPRFITSPVALLESPHWLWNIFPGTNAHKSVFISRSGSHTSSNPSLETLKTQTQHKKRAILLLTNIACKAVEALTFSTAPFPATQTHLQPLASPCSLPESTHSHMQTTLDPRCATPNKHSRDKGSPFPWGAPTAFAPWQLGLSPQPFHPKSGYLTAAEAERYLLAEPGWVLLIGGDNARKPEDGDEEK